VGAGPGSAAASRAGVDQAARRPVEMSFGRGAVPRRGARVVLDSTDPAIPIDRVPYFTSDLMRLGIVAAVMVVLLVGGAQLIPFVVK
jgi:hypothetical protein